ncbi:hypothetical protein O181_001334 [Austropuccinia psidii MF-1]|uniref:Uncharacterized protein n=1 Tax=Austropuccinia psidii MF-1 TaxID=1389203 RepID=A0A9Q3GBR8_9BASI|nr:hypothetical protein [Austropuccinia psidii MF-1]
MQGKRVTILHNYRTFTGETRIKGQGNNYFKAEEKEIRTNDPEVVSLSQGSTQKQQIVSKSDRISTPTIRNDIPTKNEHSVATPESNTNRNELCSKMSQFEEQTQENFEELHENNLRLQELLNLQNTTIQTIQEGWAKPRKASG